MNTFFCLVLAITVLYSISGKSDNEFLREMTSVSPAPSGWSSSPTPAPPPGPAPQPGAQPAAAAVRTPRSVAQPAPVLLPWPSSPAPLLQPAPAPAPARLAPGTVPQLVAQPAAGPPLRPVTQCPIPECRFPSVCVQAAVYATCVPPTSSSATNTCSTPGPSCLTTVMLTSTKTETSTAVATLTNTETTTKTALTTKTHTQTDVITDTSTLTTTNTEVATSTHHTTQTSTAILTSHVPVTSTTTFTTTQTHNATNVITATKTSTATATSTLTTTSTAKTTETLTATSTAVLTQTLTNTQTTTLTATSTSVVTTCSASCTKIGCDKGLDIGIIIDASESIKTNNFQICKEFVANLTRRFNVSAKGTHFGVIVYSDIAKLKVNFTDYNPEKLREKIMDISYDEFEGGTRTDIALQLASTDLFSVKGGDRGDKPNVLIVITDGNVKSNSTPLPDVLAPMRNKVLIMAVSVGKQEEINMKNLQNITFNDTSHIFRVDNYRNLTSKLDKLIAEKSCLVGGPNNPSQDRTTGKPVGQAMKQEFHESCPVHFLKQGCFNDLKSPRPLPKLMFSDLDKNSAKFSGIPVDWGRWNNYLDDVVCRCAQVSKAKGFQYFGIENFAECWSGQSADKTYRKDGPSQLCITKEFAQCDSEDNKACSGNKTTTFIYKLEEDLTKTKQGGCYTQIKKFGCYADRGISPRPLPELIFTDMDKNSPKYSGQEAQLGELDAYLSDVLCRCAELVQELGYEYFGVQNHGECYSGPNIGQTYSKDGTSEQCITRDFQKCPAVQPGSEQAQQDCVGVQGSNYVYRVVG